MRRTVRVDVIELVGDFLVVSAVQDREHVRVLEALTTIVECEVGERIDLPLREGDFYEGQHVPAFSVKISQEYVVGLLLCPHKADVDVGAGMPPPYRQDSLNDVPRRKDAVWVCIVVGCELAAF